MWEIICFIQSTRKCRFDLTWSLTMPYNPGSLNNRKAYTNGFDYYSTSWRAHDKINQVLILGRVAVLYHLRKDTWHSEKVTYAKAPLNCSVDTSLSNYPSHIKPRQAEPSRVILSTNLLSWSGYTSNTGLNLAGRDNVKRDDVNKHCRVHFHEVK